MVATLSDCRKAGKGARLSMVATLSDCGKAGKGFQWLQPLSDCRKAGKGWPELDKINRVGLNLSDSKDGAFDAIRG
jgi:hypothetical protein